MTQDEEVARLNTRLRGMLLHRLPEPGLFPSVIEGLRFSRRDEEGKPEHCFDKPLVSIIVQGSKRAVMGSAHFQYEENQCLVVGIDMPNAFQIARATPERPFLTVGMHLDSQLIAQLMTEISVQPGEEERSDMGMSVVNAGVEVLSAFLRLVGLLETPARIPVLAFMIVREIHFLLLTGPHGAALRRINTFGTQSNQVARAIAWMRSNFTGAVQIEDLAYKVNMGVSTFHRHFKEVTSLSPLQYLKRLRLYEAQRLMLVERHDASSAGLAVGYESPAQFNREYKRLFGEPPLRDVKRLRHEPVVSAS